MTRTHWTPALDARLGELYPTHAAADIAALLGVGINAVYARASTLGLKKPVAWIAERARARSLRPDHGGRAHRFAKGITPWNKGTHYVAGGRSKETRFQPGQKPHTWQPIGHERISDEGYPQVKMSDTGVTRRDYVNVHHLVWFYAGRGDIPPGHALGFKDGNKLNADLANLELISRAELMRRNSFHRYGPEVAAAIQLKGAITRQINRRNQHADHQ